MLKNEYLSFRIEFMAANTIVEVISQLDGIVKSATSNSDRCGYFAALYKKVTLAVFNKIQTHYFDDNQRMERLDVVFANRYLEAYQQFKNKQGCSSSWQIAFDASLTWQPFVIDHLFLGMNAHIGLDLGIATATVCTGGQIQSIQSDFNKINIILSDLVDEVKSDLYSMWPLSKSIVNLRIGKLEQVVADFSMKIAREAAWKSGSRCIRFAFRRSKNQLQAVPGLAVANFSKTLLHPPTYLKLAKNSARLFEFGKC